MAQPKQILASDLDGTLIRPPGVGGSEGIAAFRERVGGRQGLLLAYVTGRHFAHAVEGIHATGLPVPDVLVCDVGTSLYRRVGEGFEVDPEYVEEMRAAMGGHTGDDARSTLLEVAGLELQEPPKQGEFKASFYFEHEARVEVSGRARRVLSDAAIRANVVISRDPETGRGLLDALPPGVAKDYALRFLDRRAEAAETVTFAGDSGNDCAALLAGYQAIVVGNARPELVTDLRAEAERRGLTEQIYFARASYADGVLEGCRHFGVL